MKNLKKYKELYLDNTYRRAFKGKKVTQKEEDNYLYFAMMVIGIVPTLILLVMIPLGAVNNSILETAQTVAPLLVLLIGLIIYGYIKGV